MNGVAQHSSGYSGRISPVAFAKKRPTSAFTSEHVDLSGGVPLGLARHALALEEATYRAAVHLMVNGVEAFIRSSSIKP